VEDAAAVIGQIERWQRYYLEKYGTHLVHASDEWYLLAGRDLPPENSYDGYPQLENGVGMVRLLIEEVREELDRIRSRRKEKDGRSRAGEKAFCSPPDGTEAGQAKDPAGTGSRRVTIATGRLAAPIISSLAGEIRELFPNSKPVQATVLGYPVINATPGIGHAGTFQRLSGCDAPTQELRDQLSCDKLVTENTPPAFLWHTATDAAAPVMNSMLYAQALLEKGIPVSLHIYPFGKHGLSTVDELTNRELEDRAQMNRLWLTELQQWLKQIL
jgi:hypothetical protein